MARERWSLTAVLAFGLMVVAWGGNYLFVRIGEGYVDPLWLATLRAAVGAAGVGAYLAVSRSAVAFSRRDVRDAALLGIPNTAVFLGLWFTAAPEIAPGVTAVVVYTFPLWVALLSPSMLGSRLGSRHWLAVGIGFGGVVLVSEPWTAAVGRHDLLPFAELIAAAISWAAATLGFQRRFAPAALPRANGYQLLGGACALAVVAVAFRQASVPPASPWLWVAVAWLGLFGTAFAYGVWFHQLRTVHASALSAYAFLVPLVALTLSGVVLGERLSVAQGVGVALVLLGIFLVGSRAPSNPRLPSPGFPKE
ncbi:MAG TPA: EamA family transporter [Thermoplasmata archaeon]|nr:EamA family transporter [Thermoplasmata archaeon]